jgi:hypothetical protein
MESQRLQCPVPFLEAFHPHNMIYACFTTTIAKHYCLIGHRLGHYNQHRMAVENAVDWCYVGEPWGKILKVGR